MNETELWKDIQGYEGYYQVSNFGRIKSLSRFLNYVDGQVRFMEGKIIQPRICVAGYALLNLHKDGKQLTVQVHRVVALHFLERTSFELIVHHIDEDRLNNKVENLEWVSRSFNTLYGDSPKKIANSKKKSIIQLTLQNEVVKIWESAKEVEDTLGFNKGHLGEVCSGKHKTAYGYLWKFA